MERRDGIALAPEGQVWVCAICGRRAKSRWGFDAKNNSTVLDYGYDSSCMSHSVLCFEERGPDGAWLAVVEMKYISMKIKLEPEAEHKKKPYSPPKLRQITDPDELERVRALFGTMAV